MMKQEDLFKKLGLILNELNEQYQFLAQNPQQLNELELELFYANASFLADHAQIVKKMALNQHLPLALPPETDQIEVKNEFIAEDIQDELEIEPAVIAIESESETLTQLQSQPQPQPEPEPEPEPEIEEIEQEIFRLDNTPSSFEFIVNDHAEHEKFEFESRPVDELFNRPLSDEEERVLAEKRKLNDQLVRESNTEDEDEIGPEPFLVHQEDEKVEEETVDDFPIELENLEMVEAPVETTQINRDETVEDPSFEPTLNDLLAGKSTNGGNINSTSSVGITDLRQAINLNDKLLYIKDLFNGYNLAYAEAIDLANKLPNFEAADNFFQKNYAQKNDWASKQATVDKFCSLLNQRFKS